MKLTHIKTGWPVNKMWNFEGLEICWWYIQIKSKINITVLTFSQTYDFKYKSPKVADIVIFIITDMKSQKINTLIV